MPPADFTVKDSGVRQSYDSGMVRDTQDGKARFDLLLPDGVPYDEQFITRAAMLMTRGAGKYGLRNWEKASSDVEVARFKGSALRHFMQWYAGESDEDHSAAVVFNLIAAETTAWKIAQRRKHALGKPGGKRHRRRPHLFRGGRFLGQGRRRRHPIAKG